MGKKRKLEIDVDAERHLYTSFVSAANAITQLYATAQQQQRNASATASRQALARLVHWVMREYGNQETIPKAALMHFLHQEYEGLDGCEAMPQHPFPTPQVFPTLLGHAMQQAQQAPAEDAAMDMSQGGQGRQATPTSAGRRASAAMDDGAQGQIPGFGGFTL